jgi:multiple sugar transport system substrate-binding protein
MWSTKQCSRCHVVLLVLAIAVIWAVQANAAGKPLVVWYPDVDWANPKVIESYLQEFSRETGIAVEGYPTAWSDLHQKIKVAVAGGAGPDVAIVNREEILAWVVVNRMVEPLDAVLGPDFRRGDYIDATIKEVQFQGRLYGMPFDFQLRGLFWNTRLFAEAGLPPETPPRNLDELVEYDRKLTRISGDTAMEQLGFYPHGDNWYAQGWIWTFGGDIFDWNKGIPTIDTPRNRQVYEWMESWGRRYPFTMVTDFYGRYGASGDSLGAFMKERVGITMQAATHISTNIRPNHPDLQFKTGVVPQPPGGANGIWAGGLGIIMPVGCKDPAAAGKLIKFLTSSTIQQRWFETTERFPAHRRALATVRIRDENMRAIAAQSEEQKVRPPLYGVIAPAVNNAKIQVMRLLQAPAAAVAEAQKTVEARFAEVKFTEMWNR